MTSIKELKEMLKTQSDNVYDDYSDGYYNGMEFGIESFASTIEKIKEIVETQSEDIQDDHSAGYYNGVELISSIIEGREPHFKENRNGTWFDERPIKEGGGEE